MRPDSHPNGDPGLYLAFKGKTRAPKWVPPFGLALHIKPLSPPRRFVGLFSRWSLTELVCCWRTESTFPARRFSLSFSPACRPFPFVKDKPCGSLQPGPLLQLRCSTVVFFVLAPASATVLVLSVALLALSSGSFFCAPPGIDSPPQTLRCSLRSLRACASAFTVREKSPPSARLCLRERPGLPRSLTNGPSGSATAEI